MATIFIYLGGGGHSFIDLQKINSNENNRIGNISVLYSKNLYYNNCVQSSRRLCVIRVMPTHMVHKTNSNSENKNRLDCTL